MTFSTPVTPTRERLSWTVGRLGLDVVRIERRAAGFGGHRCATG